MFDQRLHRTGSRGRAMASTVLLVAIGAIAATTGLVLLGVPGLLIMGAGLWLAARSSRSTSPERVLGMLGARPLHRAEVPQLARAVAVLAQRAGLTRPPRLALLPNPSLNALATGSGEEGIIAVTPGILRTLTPRQLVGVLAHEISHLRAADLRTIGLASSMARFTQTLALAGSFLLFLGGPTAFATGVSTPLLVALLWGPSVATLLLLALSRAREHDADADAADLTGDPEGLAQALWVLERHSGAMWEALNPGRAMPPAWLRTHPTTESRVENLRRISLQTSREDQRLVAAPRPSPGGDPPTSASVERSTSER